MRYDGTAKHRRRSVTTTQESAHRDRTGGDGSANPTAPLDRNSNANSIAPVRHRRGELRYLLNRLKPAAPRLRVDRRVAGLTMAGLLAAGAFTTAGMIDTGPRTGSAADTVAVQEALRTQENERSSRGETRTAPGTGAPTAGTRSAPATKATKAPVKAATKPPVTVKPKPVHVPPVGGLTQRQMDYATTIVRVAERKGLPERAMVVAISTALQETYLRNLASTAVPESQSYTNDGSGSDHDSVGLFQQRASSGWGPVNRLMDPAFAANQFFDALAQVSGWQQMSITQAAQTVQVSAFPDAYAQHEGFARQIVNAIRH
jgi:hypothetical protein